MGDEPQRKDKGTVRVVPRYRLPIVLLNKAKLLTQRGAVTSLSDSVFTVEGFTGIHWVKVLPNEKLSCDCPGFQEHGYCSHITAVMLLLEESEEP